MSDSSNCSSCAGACGPGEEVHTSVLMWHIAFVTNCNLRCTYCNTGYGMMGRKPKVMSREKQARLIEVIIDRAQGQRSVTLQFGIGETFMVFDEFMQFVKAVKAAAAPHGLHINIAVSTNGVPLDRKRLQTIADHGISLRFSIDGPAEVHDAHRVGQGGAGSHAQALASWKMFNEIISEIEHPPSSIVNSVIGERSSLALVAKYWREQGLQHFDAHVTDDSPYLPNTAGRLERLRAHYLRDFEELAMREARRLSVPHFMSDFWGPKYLYDFWTKLFLESPRSGRCGVGLTVLAVDPEGTFYPCDSFIGYDNNVFGSLENGVDSVALAAMSAEVDRTKHECETCSANHLCNQGCAASHPEEGVVLNSHGGCDYFRDLVRITEASYAVLKEPVLEPVA